MYYILSYDRSYDRSDDWDYVEFNSSDLPDALVLDAPITCPMPLVEAVVTDITAAPDIWWMAFCFVMSQRAVSLLRSVGENHFEQFRLSITDAHGNRDVESHSVVHLIDAVPCMDLDRSRYKLDESGYVSQIFRLVLKEHAIPSGRHLFPLEESPTDYIVTEQLKSAFEQANVTGVSYIPVDEFWTTYRADMRESP